jgi:hypothetical protein
VAYELFEWVLGSFLAAVHVSAFFLNPSKVPSIVHVTIFNAKTTTMLIFDKFEEMTSETLHYRLLAVSTMDLHFLVYLCFQVEP